MSVLSKFSIIEEIESEGLSSKHWTITNKVKIATKCIVCSRAFLIYMLDEFNFYRQHKICIYTVMVAKIVQTCNV